MISCTSLPTEGIIRAFVTKDGKTLRVYHSPLPESITTVVSDDRRFLEHYTNWLLDENNAEQTPKIVGIIGLFPDGWVDAYLSQFEGER